MENYTMQMENNRIQKKINKECKWKLYNLTENKNIQKKIIRYKW